MDISKFDIRTESEEGARVVIRDPLGQPTDIIVTVLGQDSPSYRAAAKKISMEPFEKDRPRDEQAAERAARLTAAGIKDWSGLEENGKSVDYSPEKALEFCANPAYDLFASQVYSAILDRSLFFGKSAKA